MIIMLIICPYTCARSCCRSKIGLAFNLSKLYLGCKKDHTRTDYRKADKNRPGVYYLVCGVLMLIVDMLIIYQTINVFFYTSDSICKEAKFIDSINIGTD